MIAEGEDRESERGGKGERARGREKGMRDMGRERDRKDRGTEERREKEKKKKKRRRKRGRKEGRQPTCHLLRIPAQFLERWSSNGLIYTKVLMAYSGYALQRSLSAQRLCETLCTLRNHRFKRNFF